MNNTDALTHIKHSLTSNAAFLRNTIHIPGQTCATCRGTHMRDGYQTCYQCEFNYNTGADLIGSMIYGVHDRQSGKMMYAYKAPKQIPVLVRHVSSLVALALRGHLHCAEQLAATDFTHWATVPSLRNIGTEHPFHVILNTILPSTAEIAVAASPLASRTPPPDRRQHNPDLYELRTTVPPGASVLILDDTWTSGAHSQSVATALKRAGAGKVAILAVARWLDSDSHSTKIYNKLIQPRPYDPEICPWTGGTCPG